MFHAKVDHSDLVHEPILQMLKSFQSNQLVETEATPTCCCACGVNISSVCRKQQGSLERMAAAFKDKWDIPTFELSPERLARSFAVKQT